MTGWRVGWVHGPSAIIEEMIRENSESRVWLGVHWKFDADEGEASGKAIAEVVHGRACRRA